MLRVRVRVRVRVSVSVRISHSIVKSWVFQVESCFLLRVS